jgi:hypothetical protein
LSLVLLDKGLFEDMSLYSAIDLPKDEGARPNKRSGFVGLYGDPDQSQDTSAYKSQNISVDVSQVAEKTLPDAGTPILRSVLI